MSDTAHDVLITAAVRDVMHKRPYNLGPDEAAFWRVNGTPRQTEPSQHIWFASSIDDSHIHSHGEITALEDGKLWFDAAHETYVPCLDAAPSRGFTYIEPLTPRLEATDWTTLDTGKLVVGEKAREVLNDV